MAKERLNMRLLARLKLKICEYVHESSNMNVTAKEAPNSEVLMPHTHLHPGSTEGHYNLPICH